MRQTSSRLPAPPGSDLRTPGVGGGGGGGGGREVVDTASEKHSGTSLLWTPWGHSKVSCIERCLHFRGKFLLRK